jgi:hypothetical protein
MPRGQELVRADDGEAHEVVAVVGHPLGLGPAGGRPPQAAVGGDVQALVGGVDAQTVHMLRAGVGGEALLARARGGFVRAAAREERRENEGDEQSEHDVAEVGGREKR